MSAATEGDEPTQTTPQGAEIPVPSRSAVTAAFRKVASAPAARWVVEVDVDGSPHFLAPDGVYRTIATAQWFDTEAEAAAAASEADKRYGPSRPKRYA